MATGNIDSTEYFLLSATMALLRVIIAAWLVSAGPGFGSIENMEQGYYTEDAFKRISEYFTGIEDQGDRVILRSDPLGRTGHYVKFNLSKSYAVERFQLEVLGFEAKETATYTFEVDGLLDGEKPIYLGLTGEEWQDKKRPPVAYKLVLLDAAGNILASAGSFLWGDG